MDVTLPPDKPPPPPANPAPAGGGGGPPPRKLTPELIEAFGIILSEGNFRSVACQRLHIHPATFKRWMALGKKYPNGIYATLRARVLEAEAVAERLAVRAIVAAGLADDPRHLQWWLERKYPQRWGRYRGELGELKRRIAELEKIVGESTDPVVDGAGEGS